MSEAGRDRKAI